MNNKLKIILPIVLVSSSAFIIFQIKSKNINQNSNIKNNSPTTTKITSTDKNIITSVYQKLSIIGNRCIGCGKCVRIDPSHFEMNGNISSVISSQNLGSSSLKLAINNCPVQAITLE